MISFIEGPHEDEPLFSLLARIYHSLIGPSRAQFANHLFGNPRLVLPFDFPCGLDALTERLGCRLGLTTDDLIQHHTMLPIAAFLMSAEQAERVKLAMRGISATAPNLIKWHRQRSRDGMRRLHFCEKCQTEDRAKHGYTWWRRVHQVPDVFCCAVHGTPLEASQFVQGQFWKLDYPLADDAQSVGTTLRPDRLDVAYARSVRWMLSNRPFPIDTQRLHQLYHDRLEKRGLLRSGQLQRTEFLHQFFAQRSEHEWAQRQMLFDPNDASAWPAQTVKTKANHRSFRTHLLVMSFLEIPISQIQQRLAEVTVDAERPRDGGVREILRRHWFDAAWTMHALKKKCRCGIVRLLRSASEEGLPIPRQPDTKRAKRFCQRRARFRAVFLSGRAKVSSARWRRAMKWLGRNDGCWLRPKLTRLTRRSSSCVDWRAREEDSLAKLPQLAARTRAERPFRRVSAEAFLSLLPFGRSNSRHLKKKMPRLAREMKRLTETYDEFTLRRVKVIRRLHPDLPPFVVRERASVCRTCRDEKILYAMGYVLVGKRWMVPGCSDHPLYGITAATGKGSYRDEEHAVSA